MADKKPEDAKDNEAQEGDAEATEKKKGIAGLLAKPALYIPLALVLAVGGAGGGWYFATGGGGNETRTEAASQKEAAHGDSADAPTEGREQADAETALIPLPEIQVNVVSTQPDGHQVGKFMAARLTLIVPETAVAEVEKKIPYLNDRFSDFLRQVDEAEIKGTPGLVMLRHELLRRARAVAGDGVVEDVLITNLLVQ